MINASKKSFLVCWPRLSINLSIASDKRDVLSVFDVDVISKPAFAESRNFVKKRSLFCFRFCRSELVINIHRVFAKRIVKWDVVLKKFELSVTAQKCFLFFEVMFCIVDEIDYDFLHIDLFETRVLSLLRELENFIVLNVHLWNAQYIFTSHFKVPFFSVEQMNCRRIQSLIAVMNFGFAPRNVIVVSKKPTICEGLEEITRARQSPPS